MSGLRVGFESISDNNTLLLQKTLVLVFEGPYTENMSLLPRSENNVKNKKKIALKSSNLRLR